MLLKCYIVHVSTMFWTLNANQKLLNNCYSYKKVINKSVLLSPLQKQEESCRDLIIEKKPKRSKMEMKTQFIW